MNRMFSGAASFLFASLLGMLLSGCASPNPATVTIDKGEGAVVLRVVFDQSEKSGLLQLSMAAEHVELERVTTAPDQIARSYWVPGTVSPTRSASVYGGPLKAGQYKIVGLRGSSGNWTGKIPFGSLFDTVEIRDGEVTFLGTVLIKPTGGSALSFGYVPPDAELTQLFEQRFPTLAAQVKGRPAHALELTPESNAAAGRAQLFKRDKSAVINGLWQDEKGNFFAGSRMGKVLLKQAGQQGWRETNVGSWRSVSSVKPYRSGLIAGGEDGLFKITADGKTWSDLVPPAWGQIAHVEVVRNDRLVVVVRGETGWTAFATEDPVGGAWKPLGTLPMQNGVMPFPPYGVSFVRRDDALVIGGSAQDRIHFMDLGNGSVESIQNPVVMVHSISPQANGSLVIRGAVFKHAAMLSEDGGRTWRELKSRGFVAFKDSLHAYFVYDMHVAYSRDGGNKWVYQDDASWKEGDVRDFVIDRSDQSLLVFLHNGSIHRSRDEGATWTRER